ncbi:bacteriohemerythrin [Clostridium sp. 'White wine YQ']|uniref:bacteriohemerythrin n=1 Tax=Clostridium sp. 'White wine YQ' TaxID=3027474 RepID=UPI0023672C85|nr:hemerythrin family protein [Clostridium sp. 'White wine YQ']MDD7795755.1 hemerythrin family protein [Clostridium sp. 'White wine YQ']
MFNWKDEYYTGVDFIDEQHKRLFEIAGRAYDVYKNDFIMDKFDKIVEIIGELKDYTEYHFGQEEAFMMKNNYKKFLSHKVEHDDLMKDINGIDFNKIDKDQESSLLDLINFVVDWIQNHILKVDLNMTKEVIN